MRPTRTASILILLGAALGACQGAGTAPATGAPASAAAAPTGAAFTALATPAPTTSAGPTGVLAFQRTGDEGGIFTIHADGSNEHRVLRGTYGTPKWSPDGTRLAIYHETSDGVSVAIVGADGSGYQELPLEPGLNCGLAAWTPLGDELALECWSDEDAGATGIYLVAIDGSTAWRRLTTGHGLPSEFSADGKHLLFALDVDGQTLALREVDTDGSNEHAIGFESIGQMPGFIGGVGEIYVVADGAIVILNPTGTVGHTISAPEPKIHEARLSPDGRFFAFIYDPLAAVAPGLYRIGADGSGFGVIAHTNVEGIQEEHPDWMP
jgi:hypothetical protein